MTVPFQQIPANIRVPLFYAEVNPSQANSGVSPPRTLLVGQATSAGTATIGVPVYCPNVAQARVMAGPNSMLALMYAVYRLTDTFGEVWILPLADPSGATAATGTIAIAVSTVKAGTLSVYVNGQLYAIPVTPTSTAITIGDALAAAINADKYCAVTAVNTSGSVALTAVNAGVIGNEIDLRVNYLGSKGGEALPGGVTATPTLMASGAGLPTTNDLNTGLGNLANQAMDFICWPYSDTTSLNTIGAFLNDTAGRWAWSVMLYGHAFSALRGTVGALTTAGTGRNDQHVSIMGFRDSPSPAWLWAAAFTAAAAGSLRVDPALPLQTVQMFGLVAPPLHSRFLLSDRNTLLWDGISTFSVDDDGSIRIENAITTYQLNAFSQADDSYLEVETLFTLAYMLRYLRARITSRYARCKLADDGTLIPPGSAIVTPSIIKGDQIAAFNDLISQGVAQNADAFKANLVVERNAGNPNRIDVLWPGSVINQLRVFALLAQFRLT